METLEIASKCPFSSFGKGFLEKLGLTLEQLEEHPVYSAALRLAGERLKAALRGELKYEAELKEEKELAVLSFTLARVLALTLGDSVAERFAEAEAKLALRFLKEDLRKSDPTAKLVAEELGVKVGSGTMGFVQYLKLASRLATFDERWKLVNRVVEGGQVKGLSLADEFELLKEAIRQKILEAPKRLEVFGKFKHVLEDLRKELTQPRPREEARGEMPPCINQMLAKLELGEASHLVRFVIGAYLLNAGFSVERALEVFKRSSDFKEKVSRYQLEFIAGLRGSKTKYSCPSCETIRNYGLCVSDCGIRHPLQYGMRTA